MDITELVKMVAQMTGMSQKEQEQLEELMEKLDIDDIDALNDLENFDLDNLDDFDFDIDGGMGPRPGKRSVDDYRRDSPDKSDKSVQDEVNVKISDDDEPYHGHTWVEVEDGYESFVDIPDLEENSVDISLRESSVTVSDPIGEELSTSQLPTEVNNLDAEVTEGGRLLIRVW